MTDGVMTERGYRAELIGHLPIAAVVDQVREALLHGNVLLQAAPGAGKSTGLPLALLGQAAPDKRIVMLEPRRLAARSVAERLATQLNEPVGRRVGLRMRGDTRVSAHTTFEVVTEGVLTRLLQQDPELDGVACVIFDEFHERSLHADVGLALCLDVQNSLRHDLRLLFMSATLNSDLLASHLERHRHPGLAPLQNIHAPGRQHPVELRWRDAVEPVAGRQHGSSPAAGFRLLTPVVNAVLHALEHEPGDMLVFLPGVAEIEAVARMLGPKIDARAVASKTTNTDIIIILRLHAQVDRKAREQATAAAVTGQRRIILGTSIAETSLTIDGVRVVIDSGLERRGRMDSGTGAMHLETVSSSQASATQRAGRAGRTAPGVCYRLWSEQDHARRTPDWQAEIHRTDLSPLLLELLQWGINDVADLPWLEEPPAAGIARARELLQFLGVLDGTRLSAPGAQVASLPVHPRLGAMLVWAAGQGVADRACVVAALLEDETAPRELDINVLLGARQPRHRERRASTLNQQLGRVTRVAGTESSPRPAHAQVPTAVLVAHAFPDRIARRRPGREARYALSGGTGAVMPEQEPLAQSDWLAVARLGGSTRESRILQACALDVDTLRSCDPALFADHRVCQWDDVAGRVVAEQQERLGSLLVDARPLNDIGDDERQRALLSGIRKHGIDCLPWTEECRQWQARVQQAGRLAPEILRQQNLSDAWPDVSDDALAHSLEHWLPAWLQGVGSLKALSGLKLQAVLQSLLSYPQQVALERLCPTRFVVPSGSSISLRYLDDDVVLSVKLQEMFGCLEHPSIGAGTIKLKVELLSPARRPVQITSDLGGFWDNSYAAVRKELAGRYPKHPWPDDPENALPTARVKAREPRRR